MSIDGSGNELNGLVAWSKRSGLGHEEAIRSTVPAIDPASCLPSVDKASLGQARY